MRFPLPFGLLELIDQVPGELWSARLGLSLTHERAKGPKSMFTPYINLLPAVHSGIPLFFGPDAVRELQYPPVVEQLKRRSRFLISFANGPLAAAVSAPHGGPFDGFAVDANALGWAFACASSRAFRVGGPHLPAAMLPLVDVANHSFEPSAVVRPALGLGPGAIEMVASRSVQAGEEISLNYGDLTNDALLLDYGFVPEDNPHDAAGLRWDLGLIEAAREVAGLSAVPFGAAAAAAGAGASASGSSSSSADVYFAPWQKKILRDLRLEKGVGGGGGDGGGVDPEVLVTRNARQPVDPRLLAGLRILYASSPADLVDGGGGGGGHEGTGDMGSGGGGGDVAANGGETTGAAGIPVTLGSLWDSPLDRVREAYALRTCQAALALALGNFPTTLKEDEQILSKLHSEEEKTGDGGGDGVGEGGAATASRRDVATAVRFRMEKKRVISGAMKIIDERLRAVLSSDS